MLYSTSNGTGFNTSSPMGLFLIEMNHVGHLRLSVLYIYGSICNNWQPMIKAK